MPTSLIRTALGIGGLDANIMSGDPYLFPGRAGIQIAMVSDQIDTKVTVSFGGRIVSQNAVVPVEPAANQGPNINENMFIDEPIMPGEQIILAITGGVAASITRSLVNITPF